MGQMSQWRAMLVWNLTCMSSAGPVHILLIHSAAPAGVGPLKLQAIAALALRTSLLAWLLNHQQRMSSAAKLPQPCKVSRCLSGIVGDLL